MRNHDAIFLAAESIPFGHAISAKRELAAGVRRFATCAGAVAAADHIAARVAAAAVMFGAVAGLVWGVTGYLVAL